MTDPSLHIEPLLERHLDDLAQVLRHAEVYEHIDTSVPTLDDFRLGLSRSLTGPPAHRAEAGERWLNFLVRDASGAMLGRLEATVHDGLAEVAFLFGPAHWGRGHATQGLLWLHRHLAGQHGMRRFWATTVPANHRCQALLRRVGYRPATGTLPPLSSYDAGDLVFVFDADSKGLAAA